MCKKGYTLLEFIWNLFLYMYQETYTILNFTLTDFPLKSITTCILFCLIKQVAYILVSKWFSRSSQLCLNIYSKHYFTMLVNPAFTSHVSFTSYQYLA